MSVAGGAAPRAERRALESWCGFEVSLFTHSSSAADRAGRPAQRALPHPSNSVRDAAGVGGGPCGATGATAAAQPRIAAAEKARKRPREEGEAPLAETMYESGETHSNEYQQEPTEEEAAVEQAALQKVYQRKAAEAARHQVPGVISGGADPKDATAFVGFINGCVG